MKQSHILIAILTACSLSALMYAAEPDFNAVCAGLAAHKNTTGNFIQSKTLPKANRTLKSNGTFIISTGSGIVWNTQKPFPSCVTVTSDSIIQTASDGKKTVLKTAGNETFTSISKAIQSVFSGNTDILLSSFSVDFSVQKDQSGNSDIWNAVLVPTDTSIRSFIGKMELTGSAGKERSVVLQSLKMTESAGGTILYEFTGQKYPEELTSDEKTYFTAR